MQKIIDDSN